MKLLAIDTATERCSVALLIDERIVERATETQRGHADLVLPMVEAVLAEGGLTLRQLDGLAYGRGPGGFTGVRIAVGVAQGLAYGAQLVTVGISDLAAVAQQFASRRGADPGLHGCAHERSVLGPVRGDAGRAREADVGRARRSSGSGRARRCDDFCRNRLWSVSRSWLAGRAAVAVHGAARPDARDIARLAAAELRAGRGQPPEQAQPVYLRDQVATVKPP